LGKTSRTPHFLIISAFDPLPSEGKELIRYPFLARELYRQGAHVTYLTSDFDHFTKEKRKLELNRENFDLHFLPTSPYTKNISWKRLWNHYQFGQQTIQWLNQYPQKFDGILSAWPPMEVNFAVSKWATKHQVPFFVDMQDAWPEAFAAQVPNALWKVLSARNIQQRKHVFDRAKAVMAVSEDYLTLGKVVTEKRKTIYLGGNFHEEMPRSLSPFFGNKIKLALLAGSGQLPFLKRLIKLLSKHEDYSLYLIGRSPAFYKVKSTPNLHIHTSVSEVQKHQLLSRVDIGLVMSNPAVKSSMPNKLFSYLNYGLPVLSNVQGGELAQMLEQKRWGRSCQGNLKDFDLQLQQLIDSGLLAERERIFSEAKACFDKEKIYADYAAFLLAQIYDT